MDYRFRTRCVSTPLFGAIQGGNDAAKEPWRQDFASGIDSAIWIDGVALDWLADELELDHEGLAWDAQRYVQGLYRPKAQGLSGGRLGELGEALTYLAERGAGLDIVRVLGPDTGGKAMLQGHTYCYPDFILAHQGSLRALEVKSTEALDYQLMWRKWEEHLHKGARFYMNLAPCQGAEAGREAALAQLGHARAAGPPSYALKLKRPVAGATSVPFPVRQGVAMSVMPVDGRARGLWHGAAFKTPPACRAQHRACTQCLGDAEVLMTRMPNAPGHLPLMGHGDQDMGPWFQAYQRWTQALMCHDAAAVHHATAALVGPLLDWIGGLPPRQQAAASFWGMYLREAAWQRGLDADAFASLLTGLDDHRRTDGHRGPYAGMRHEPVSEDRFLALLHALWFEDVAEPMLFGLQAPPTEGPVPSATWTVRLAPSRLDLFMMSGCWWRHEGVQSEFQAAGLVQQMLNMLARALGDAARAPAPDALDVVRQQARVGDVSVLLGWSWRAGLRHLLPPHCRIRVTPDGRVQLTVRRPG